MLYQLDDIMLYQVDDVTLPKHPRYMANFIDWNNLANQCFY